MGEVGPKDMTKKAMVMLSGGQDSATCLAWALDKYELVETIGFSYGQRHIVELDCRQTVLSEIVKLSSKWCRRLGPDRIVPLDGVNKLSDSALLNQKKIDNEPGKYQTHLFQEEIYFFLLTLLRFATREEFKQ